MVRLCPCTTCLENDAILSHFTFSFYPRDALHSAVFAVVRSLSIRPSICPSHASIVSEQLNLS